MAKPTTNDTWELITFAGLLFFFILLLTAIMTQHYQHKTDYKRCVEYCEYMRDKMDSLERVVCIQSCNSVLNCNLSERVDDESRRQ